MLTLTYEMTDKLAADAAREYCVALVREHTSLRDLLLVAGSTVVFALAVARDGHWLWWIAAVPPALLVGLLVAWLILRLWLPRQSVARLARLPHRRVTLEMSDAGFAFATAVERLELAWSELGRLQRLKSFWLFCTEGGARIPVPVDVMSADQLAFVQSRTAAPAR